MIEGISIANFSEMNFYNKFEDKITMLPNLKKVNIFIGENNCGKSRVMRSFAKQDFEIFSSQFVSKSSISDYKRYLRLIREFIVELKESDIKELVEILKYVPLEIDDIELFYIIDEIFPHIEKIKDKLIIPGVLRIKTCINELKYAINSVKNYSKDVNGKTIQYRNTTYIPILRGIENFEIYFKNPPGFESIKMTENEFKAFQQYKNNAKQVYKNKVTSSYKISQYSIFTAEELYDEITNKLLGNEQKRKFVREFEKFIAKNFYDNIEFSITPYKTEHYLGIKIGNNEDRALYDLGEGIKQLIVLFYKIFEQKDEEAIFLIEEPELNLHPGFQRKFIEIITKEFPKHQFFITTHSNHIIDLYNEQDNISIYKFKNKDKKNNKFYLERVQPKDASILDEIGAKNSSVFMSNCTIWIEGISDKIYISKYLELYFKKENITTYKEDIHYSFVEYGGNNITHWSFIDDNDVDTINASAITHNIFIICDNDNNAKQARKEKLREIFAERLYVLKSREIENLLSKKVLEETLKADNKLNSLEYKRYKTKGYTEKMYAKPDVQIAKFIDSTFNLNKTYAGKYNALKNKADFAKKAIEKMESFEDLSEEAKELTIKIVNFIKEKN